MEITNLNHPLVKLPPSIDLTLYLIREELKSQRFFSGLDKVGLGDCFYQPHLSRLILSTMGMDANDEQTLEFYYRVVEKRCKKINPDNESVMRQAVKAYVDLVAEKRRRNSS